MPLQRMCDNGSILIDIIGLLVSPPIPHPPSPIPKQLAWWNGPLKIQLQDHLGNTTLQIWGQVLQQTLCALNMWYISPTARIHEPKNQGVGMGGKLIIH